jgi:hypothetical protein
MLGRPITDLSLGYKAVVSLRVGIITCYDLEAQPVTALSEKVLGMTLSKPLKMPD